MISDYLKAGYPSLCILTQEPDRPESLPFRTEHWDFFCWDCLRGIRQFPKPQVVDEIRDPVEAIQWLAHRQDTMLLTHNLHLFLDIPEVIPAIQNGVSRWKASGCCLLMVAPVIGMRPELEKLFTIIDLPLPDEEALFNLQMELAGSVRVDPGQDAVRAAKGLTECEAETAFALSLIKEGRFSTRVVSEAKAQAKGIPILLRQGKAFVPSWISISIANCL